MMLLVVLFFIIMDLLDTCSVITENGKLMSPLHL